MMYRDKLLLFKEKARRIKGNLDQLGYIFNCPDCVLGTPSIILLDHIRFLEASFGPLPSALKEFYETIGSFDFTGHHPNWVLCEYPDPLVVVPIESVISELYPTLEYSKEAIEFHLPLAPDLFHKQDVSGGAFYKVVLPCNEDNPKVIDEWHNTTFIEYLEICLKWGCFPGLEKYVDHDWPLEEILK